MPSGTAGSDLQRQLRVHKSLQMPLTTALKLPRVRDRVVLKVLQIQFRDLDRNKYPPDANRTELYQLARAAWKPYRFPLLSSPILMTGTMRNRDGNSGRVGSTSRRSKGFGGRRDSFSRRESSGVSRSCRFDSCEGRESSPPSASAKKPRTPVSRLFGCGRILAEAASRDAPRGEVPVSRATPFNDPDLRGIWNETLTSGPGTYSGGVEAWEPSIPEPMTAKRPSG